MWITVRGEYDRDGVLRCSHRPLLKTALAHGAQQVEEPCTVERCDDLGLGVAEAHVVLEQFRTLGSQHHPGVEDAAKINGALVQFVHRGRDDTRHDFFDEFAGHYFHGRVGAHAAGVRSGVGVAHALEVLGGREREGSRAVKEHG